jgi:hypothetical protein
VTPSDEEFLLSLDWLRSQVLGEAN